MRPPRLVRKPSRRGLRRRGSRPAHRRGVVPSGLVSAVAIAGIVAFTSPSFALADPLTAGGPSSRDVTSTVAADPSISLVETADLTTVSALGQVVTYSFVVGNTGNVTLDNVDVTDSLLPATGSSPGPITCATRSNGSITLTPQETATCTATYTVTQADLDHGRVADTATAVGSTATSITPVTDSSVLSLPVTSVSVAESASPSSAVTAGSTVPIVYTITVTNIGTATTTAPIVVTDPAPSGTTLVGDSPACTGSAAPSCWGTVNGSTISWTIPAGVAPGASYTLNYSVTADPGDGTGAITNTASWSGPGCGAPEPAGITATSVTACSTDTVNSPVTAAPVTGAAVTSPPVMVPVAAGTPATGAVLTPATAAPPTPALALASTGALLSLEWVTGLVALAFGAAMMLVARSRRRNAKDATR